MKKLKIVINMVLLAASVFLGHQAMAAKDKKAVVSNTSFQNEILYYVNQYRAKHHLSPLKMNNLISQQAAKHSQDMASHRLAFGHTNFNGRIKRLYTEIGECRGGAENVAFYKTDAKKLVDAWVASPGHRRNILGGYNLTGIGIAHSKKGWAYYTQIFLRSDATKQG